MTLIVGFWGVRYVQRSIGFYTQTLGFNLVNRTGLVGGPIPRQDGPNGTTQQTFAGGA